MSDKVPYLYRPLAHYAGKVLKCAGIATDVSRNIIKNNLEVTYKEGIYLPGVVETEEYLGDRIYADTLKEFDSAL